MIIIRYRYKPTIIQTQLEDYISKRIREIYEMWVPKQYRLARKRFPWISVRPRKNLSPIQVKQPTKYCKIDHWIYKSPPSTISKKPYFSRFRSVAQSSYDEFAEGQIPKMEWDMLRTLPKFTGFFNHLFELNDLGFFDEIQEELEEIGVDFKGIFIYDIIAFEFLRRQLGFHDYTGLEKMAFFLNGNPLIGILRDPFYFPSAADVSYIIRRIPIAKMMTFFHSLVREAITLGIITPRIAVLDGQFVRSNCNNNKNTQTNQYNDPEAGYYRHNGKKLGVGYVIWTVYAHCGTWDRSLPVHFTIFPGNRNDKPAFRKTLEELDALNLGEWSMVMADTGPYCQRNLDFCMHHGHIPLIRAPKHLKTHPTKELKKGYWFNTNYFPLGWSEQDILDMYSQRPLVEAGQSANPTFYNQSRLNTRGKDMAYMNRVITYSLDLLRAITARKLGRTDLLTKLRAFSSARQFVASFSWQKMAKDSGYRLLMMPSLNPRQKAFWDKRRKRKQQREVTAKKLKF